MQCRSRCPQPGVSTSQVSVVLSLRTREAPHFLWLVVQHSSVQCGAAHCTTVQCSTMSLEVSMPLTWQSRSLHCAAFYPMHCTALQCTVPLCSLHSSALSCTVYSTVLCCDAHDCIALYWQTFYLVLSQDFLPNFWGLFQDFPWTLSGLSQNILKTFSKLYIRTFQGFSQDISGLTQNFPRTL